MSFGFLSIPSYLGLCLIVSSILLYTVVKRWNRDRKGLIVLYLTIAIGAIIAASISMIKETTSIYYKHFGNMGYILMGYLGIIVVELFYLSITHKGNAKSKRTILIGWGFIVIPLLLALLVYFTLD